MDRFLTGLTQSSPSDFKVLLKNNTEDNLTSIASPQIAMICSAYLHLTVPWNMLLKLARKLCSASHQLACHPLTSLPTQPVPTAAADRSSISPTENTIMPVSDSPLPPNLRSGASSEREVIWELCREQQALKKWKWCMNSRNQGFPQT